MKSLQSSWKFCLGVVAGFTLGTLAFHTPRVRAQNGTDVIIEQVVSMKRWHQGTSPTDLPHVRSTITAAGSQVVGFSCVVREAHQDAECYVASVGR